MAGKLCFLRGRVFVLLYCTDFSKIQILISDLDVTWENGRWCPLVVHYWADVQSVHGFPCYNNIAPNMKCQRVLVLALCLVYVALGFCIGLREQCPVLQESGSR